MSAPRAPGRARILPNVSPRNVTVSTESDLKAAVEAAALPELDCSLGDVGRVRAITLGRRKATLAIELGLPAAPFADAVERIVADAVREITGLGKAKVELATRVVAHGVQPALKPLPGVANIVAVASGKGGVGKSTTAANLALALAADGAAVGLLDADIYGPSQPLMMGLAGQRPVTDDGQSIRPLAAHGVAVMSIGFLVDAEQPMAWRGPMVTQALNQLLTQTAWGELDYLFVDMPPGTGDIQLTLSQRVPVSGAVIVTTPQDIALADARKGLQMFRKVSVPVLGIVENMSTHVCSACGHEEALFGAGGGERLAADYEVALLGQLPLTRAIREQTDGGTPTVVAEPDGSAAVAYRRTARRVAARLAMQEKDYSSRFPDIVVENS